jgi:hypothetical protein
MYSLTSDVKARPPRRDTRQRTARLVAPRCGSVWRPGDSAALAHRLPGSHPLGCDDETGSRGVSRPSAHPAPRRRAAQWRPRPRGARSQARDRGRPPARSGVPLTMRPLRRWRCVRERLRWAGGRRRDPGSGHSACPSASLRRQGHRAGRHRCRRRRLGGGHDVDRRPRRGTRSHGADIAATRLARIAASRGRRLGTAGTVALRTPRPRAHLIHLFAPRFGRRTQRTGEAPRSTQSGVRTVTRPTVRPDVLGAVTTVGSHGCSCSLRRR